MKNYKMLCHDCELVSIVTYPAMYAITPKHCSFCGKANTETKRIDETK